MSTLASPFRHKSEPIFIRPNNGIEFIAKAIKRWLLEGSEVNALHLEPGSP